MGHPRLFLAAEAVDEAHVEAEVVLQGAAEGGAEVAGGDAEGEVGVEVGVEVGADGEGGRALVEGQRPRLAAGMPLEPPSNLPMAVPPRAKTLMAVLSFRRTR